MVGLLVLLWCRCRYYCFFLSILRALLLKEDITQNTKQKSETNMTTTSDLVLSTVVQSQLTSLDDTDSYSTAWTEALERASEKGTTVKWGGRGQGGRGTSRRTFQPKDIVVDNVRLEYVGSEQGGSRVLMENATLKLLSGGVYALVGRNGVGKSSLLKRIHAGKIPGFPPHVSTLYIPQEMFLDAEAKTSPLEFVLERHKAYAKQSSAAVHRTIEDLEAAIDKLDMSAEEDQARMEDLMEEISALEDRVNHVGKDVQKQAEHALEFMGVAEALWDVPITSLPAGLQKKVALSVALFCSSELLLLDEPTNHLDIHGLLQIRRLVALCQSRQTTLLLVSHDVDLINDVATDVIDLKQQTLVYYPGNYIDYTVYRRQNDLHQLRQAVALDKKRGAMMQTLENMKKQPTPRRGGAKKKSKQIESQKKKIERQGLDKDKHGHRWTQQKAGTGMKTGSINAIDASTRRGLTVQQLLEMTEKYICPPPDKAVQFVFRQPRSQWGEALILAYGVGHGYNVPAKDESHLQVDIAAAPIVKKDGYLFDCVDLCIEEGGTYCILGESSSGKSTLLRLLARTEQPLEGSIKHATNLDVALIDSYLVDSMIETGLTDGTVDALSFLMQRFPKKAEKDIRGELTAFGLSPKQAVTNLRYLSGGERCRLYLTSIMLGDPQVLILDEITSNLDVESVEALICGLRMWKGTIVMVSSLTAAQMLCAPA